MILLRSDIRLTTSDIRYASFMANRISLKPQVLISLSHKRQYHSAFAEYHYFYLPDKSKFEIILLGYGEGGGMGGGNQRNGEILSLKIGEWENI